MQGFLDLCPVPASARTASAVTRPPPLCVCPPLCVSYKDIVTGFRAHWLIQDHILILPSLTIVSQSPFIKIRLHSCVLDIRRECLLGGEVGGRGGREVRRAFWSLLQRPCAFLLDFIPSHITVFFYLVTAGIEEWYQLFI